MGITDKSIIAVLTVLAILCSASAQQTVTINEPDNGAVFQDVLSALINFTVTDDDNETLECILVVNGEDNISNTSTQNATFTVLPLLTGIYGNYTYYVKCTDYITWNASDSRWLLFNETVDMTPPVISSVENVSITNQSARITWNTDDVSNATLYWGEYPSLGNLSVNASPGTLHSISLSGLRNNTVYQYIASSCNSDGYCSNSSLRNFTTLQSVDMTPPVISSVQNVSITNQSVRITWNTDDVSNATLYWGPTSGLGNVTVNVTLGTFHSISLFGLASNTTYYYNVSSCNTDGYCANSSQRSFTTFLPSTPIIYNVQLSSYYTANNTNVTINVTVSSTVTRVEAEGVNLSNVSATLWTGTITLIAGRSPVNVIAYNAYNDSVSDNSVSFTVDTTPPVISSVAISSNYARNNTNVTVTVNASGAVSVTAEGVALSANGVIWTGTIPLVSGASPVNIVAIDNVSNQATNNALTFTIDDTAPVIQNATLSDYYVKSGDTISVIVFVFDPPQNSTATVTANGVALINTSNIRWIGNITAGANGGNLSIIATDTAGNSITDLSKAAFTVDNVAPNLTIIVPAAGGAYSVENIIFNISVAEANLSRFNVSLDNLSFYGSALNGTHLPNYTGLKTGLHTAVFSAEDRAGNSVSETRQFTVTVPLNVSQALSLLNDSIEANVTDIVLKASGVDISTNTSVDMNISVELEIKVNAAGTNITVKVPEFNGLDASWKQNFTIKTNLTASESRLANSTAGTKIESIVLLQNMSRFLSGENYEMAVVTFYVHLLGRDVLYIADDFGSKIYKLRECGSVPSSVNSVTDACYMNFTGNVTLYLPHFSGGAIANDTVAPNITVSVPVNNTLYPNSNMTLGFSVYEANPANGTFCNYTLFNGTEVITQDLDITAAEMINDGSTEYSFSVALPALLNGTYWLNISCMDANNRSTSVHRNFSISDSTVPVILSFGPTGVQSTAGTSVSVTLSVVTDESAICRYSATNVSFDNMSLILGSGSYAKSHETAISYSADDASEVWYVACRDVNGLNSLIEMISYSVDVGSGGGSSRGSSGSSAGGGGIIPTIDAITLVKSWLKLEAGEKASAALQGMAFTGLNFTAAEALTGAQFILKQTESVPADSTPLNLKVYRYLNIRELNVRENQILLPSLDFKVPKKWLMQNSLSPESIALYRFTDGWKIQPTALVFEDIEYAHYSAGPLDGFSLFAIAEKPMPIVSQTPAEQPVERTNPPGAEPEEDVIPFDDTREKPVIKLQKKKSLAWLFVFIAVVLGIAASVIYYISRKNPY